MRGAVRVTRDHGGRGEWPRRSVALLFARFSVEGLLETWSLE